MLAAVSLTFICFDIPSLVTAYCMYVILKYIFEHFQWFSFPLVSLRRFAHNKQKTVKSANNFDG